MLNLDKKHGFTLVELLVTLAIAALLISLSVPFVVSLQRDVALQKTLKQTKFEMISTLNYALAGKSFSSLAAENSTIPAAYGLYFQKGEYGFQPDLLYLELEKEKGEYSILYQHSKPLPSPSVTINQIQLKKSDKASEKTVEGVLILIHPPLGTIQFLEMSSLSSKPFPTPPLSSEKEAQVTFSFSYKHDLDHQNLTFNSQKQFSHLND